ncbi:MAG: riboflavin kinase [Planctomycetota bacterium]
MTVQIAVAVGKFDALHVGHRALIDAAASCGQPVLVRLGGMAQVLGWSERQPIVAQHDRPRILADWSRSLGQNVCEHVLDFAKLRALDANAFVALVREQLAATGLVVGADFRCGTGRATGVDELAGICTRHGITLRIVPPALIEGTPASSSRIRLALERGDTIAATACLGRPHRLMGTVQRGDGRGKVLGFPTANLGAGDNQAPAIGVYAAMALLPGKQSVPAAVNIGRLPTIAAGRALSIEAHLIGWSGDCYDAPIGLDLGVRLRDEQRFPGLDELKQQIARDIDAVTAWHRLNLKST